MYWQQRTVATLGLIGLALGMLSTPALAATTNVGDYTSLTNALAKAADGDLIVLTNNITVNGEVAISAKGLTLEGNNYSISVPVPGLNDSGVLNSTPSPFRVFNISAAGKTNTLQDLTIKGGAPASAGGGIWVQAGTVVLQNLTLSQSGGASYGGGGLDNSGGSVFMRDCNISRNAARYGGGFLNAGTGAQLFLERCTFSENRSLDTSGGGGAGQNNSSLFANNCTFANNKSTELGGAINNRPGAVADFVNCTFVGNVAYGTSFKGGAICDNGGAVTLVNCLFAYNYHYNGSGFDLNDLDNYNSGFTPMAYYCVLQSTMNQLGSSSVGNTLYPGNIAGSDDSLFCGGATALVLGPDGTPVGSATVYQPFLAKVGVSQPPTAVLKTNSFAFGKGVRAAFSSTTATPVVGYYSGGAWVSVSGSSPASYEITTDQNGVGRGTALTVGAVNATATGLFMLKVNAAANGTVSGGTIYGDNYPAGSTVTLTAIPAAGYQFSSWNYVLGGSGVASTANPFAITLTTNVTLVPVFSVYTGFTITYAGNGATGGAVPSQQVVGSGGSANIAGPGTMVRNGYLFSAWNTRSDGNGTDYAPNTVYSGPGNLSLYARWTPIPAPTIILPPASQTVAAGGSVNLNVSVTGTAPFSYQWVKDGTLVAGATNSSLAFVSAGVTNSGVYYLVVTNAYGVAISLSAAVTVSAPQLLAWGFNSYGQLGDGTGATRNLPEAVATNVIAAAAGQAHSVYLQADGTVRAMGMNTYGQLGDGTTVTRSNAVAVVGSGHAVRVAAGRYHSLYLQDNGTLWGFGINGDGQLGDGTHVTRSNAVPVASNVVAVSAGYDHSLYLKADATLWAMGYNGFGQLGDGTTTSRSVAVAVGSNVVAMAAGGLHSLYLKANGTLWAMGANGNGQLGDGSGLNHSNAVCIASNVVALAGGYTHSLYLKADGTLWGMGADGYGQLGDGGGLNRSNAVPVAANVVAIAVGGYSSFFTTSDGTLWATGDNSGGELGDGTATMQRYSPVTVPGMALAGVSAGASALHTLATGLPLPPALLSQPTNQTVVVGSSASFRVGATGFAPLAYQWQWNGTNLAGATATNYTCTSILMTNAGNYTVIVSNSVGSVTSSVAVLTVAKATPSVTVWPTASGITYGQTLAASALNGGTASVGGNFAFTSPTTAPGVGTASQAVTFTPTDATDYNPVSGTVSVTVAKAAPSVTVWPTASAITYGQTLAASALSGGTASVGGSFAFTSPTTAPGVGTASQAVKFTPTDTTDYNPVSGTVSVTVAKATPSVTAWPTASAITYGQTLAASTLSGGTAAVGGSFTFTTPTTAPGASTASQAVTFTPSDTTDYNAVGGSVSVTVTKAAALITLNNLTQTYDGTAKRVSATTLPSGLTVTLTYNGQSAAPTNAGPYTVVATVNDANYAGGATNQLRVAIAGPAVAWGLGGSGQLGNGGTTNSTVPVSLLTSGALAGKTISAIAGGNNHSYALTSDGLVYAWGANNYGQLGNNGTASSPVPVPVYTNGVLAGKRIIAIASGESHALALSADGKLFTWGWNNNLQLGNGSAVGYTNVPVAVDMTGALAGKTVVALGTGNMHNLVATADGGLFAWGYGQYGQLGNGGTTNSAVPVAVNMSGALSGKAVIAASGGWEHTVALTADGLVYAWGAGAMGQLGNGTLTDSSLPVAVTTNGVLLGKTLVAIGSGEYHCLAVGSDGRVYAWGPSSNGELGNGGTALSSVPVAVSTNGVLFGKNIVAVRGSYDSSTALSDDGQVFTWGNNANGELGNPAYAPRSYVPVAVDTSGALAGQTVVGISSSSQAFHTLVLTVGLSAPALTSATNATGVYGQPFSFLLSGNSVGAYSATGLPAWLGLDPVTGLLSGTPTNVGLFNLTITATNAFGSTTTNLALTINKATPTVTAWPTASALTYGQALTACVLSSGTALVDGTFAFSTPATVPNAGAALQAVTFTPTSTANYTTASGAVSVTVNKASLVVTANAAARVYSQANPLLDGTLVGQTNGDAITASYTTTATASSGAGTYPITAGLLDPASRLGNYNVTTNNATLTITAAGTANLLATSRNPAGTGSNVTFTATLTALSPATATPVGNVQFFSNGAALGAPVPLAQGVASLSSASLSAGSNVVQAAYLGNADFLASTNTLVQVITAPTQAPVVVGITNNANGTVTATFQGTVGATYAVYATTNLAAPGSWSAVATNVVGASGIWTYSEPVSPWPQRFFRAGVPH
jgi:uncharacterized repeat protein (TIGR02543 family)